jgi:hypothetical protein
MTSPLQECLGNLEGARKDLRAAVGRVPEARRSERPAPDRWSTNEILEHLALVERRFAAIIALRISEARATGLGPERNRREPLPASLREMLTDRAKRRNAPDAVHPSGTLDHATVWTALERIREELREIVEPAEGLSLSTVMHNHAVFGTLNVYQLLDFIAGHEARHARQVIGIAETFI